MIKKVIIGIGALMFLMPLLYPKSYSDLEDATVKVADEVGRAVVSISAEITQRIGGQLHFGPPSQNFGNEHFRQFFEEFFGQSPEREYKRFGLGSGVIIDKNGHILTNEHVVGGAEKIKVTLSDGREFDAKLVGKDSRSDLAIIKIEAKDLPVARLGDSSNLKIGQWVIAVGNPFGFAIDNPEPTVTLGVISALKRFVPALGARQRSFDDLIQTDAAINPGNSGGPLVNMQGEVIGINTAIFTTSGGYQGIGFAIPIDKVKRIKDKLIRGEKVLYGWLGIVIQDLNDDLRNYFRIKEKEGIIVVEVTKDSPAEKAGIKEGDLLLSYGDSSVKTTRDLVRMVSSSEVGKVIPVRIIREGKEKSIRVRIGKRPDDAAAAGKAKTRADAFRGMQVADITPSLVQRYRLKSKSGAVIVHVKKGSPSDKAGLEAGEVIVRIEGKRIRSKADFGRITSKLKKSCLVKTDRKYCVVKEK